MKQRNHISSLCNYTKLGKSNCFVFFSSIFRTNNTHFYFQREQIHLSGPPAPPHVRVSGPEHPTHLPWHIRTLDKNYNCSQYSTFSLVLWAFKLSSTWIYSNVYDMNVKNSQCSYCGSVWLLHSVPTPSEAVDRTWRTHHHCVPTRGCWQCWCCCRRRLWCPTPEERWGSGWEHSSCRRETGPTVQSGSLGLMMDPSAQCSPCPFRLKRGRSAKIKKIKKKLKKSTHVMTCGRDTRDSQVI